MEKENETICREGKDGKGKVKTEEEEEEKSGSWKRTAEKEQLWKGREGYGNLLGIIFLFAPKIDAGSGEGAVKVEGFRLQGSWELRSGGNKDREARREVIWDRERRRGC
ncbi:hypothetical protein ACH5RR_012782 [Cinchona calisaya]|uniref:Uncharacterized protein n=1 Tax=Cinchona calisaya TaxID=153742 RepID=A0ABD3A8P9_9GENT